MNSIIFNSRELDRLVGGGLRNASEIAEAAGIRPSYLSQLRTGKRKNPSFQVVEMLAGVLGCRPEELCVERKNDPQWPVPAKTRTGSRESDLRELLNVAANSILPPGLRLLAAKEAVTALEKIKEESHE